MKEYTSTNCSIQSAMVDMFKGLLNESEKPDHIIFDGQKVKTTHWIDVPKNFKIKLEFLSEPDIQQGVDIKISDGFLVLEDESKVKLLRTWHDPKFEKTVEYIGFSKGCRILIYNVYKEARNGHVFEEKWTINAGMLVQSSLKDTYLFKCSPSYYNPPNFDSIVFKISIFGV